MDCSTCFERIFFASNEFSFFLTVLIIADHSYASIYSLGIQVHIMITRTFNQGWLGPHQIWGQLPMFLAIINKISTDNKHHGTNSTDTSSGTGYCWKHSNRGCQDAIGETKKGGRCSDMDELVNLATLLFESIQLHYFDKKWPQRMSIPQSKQN